MYLVALIGYPLGHSITPSVYGATFPAMGIDARCEAWSTPPEALVAALRRLREPEFFGANVTVPHKEAVIPLIDDVDPSAAAIQAVNCIVRGDSGLVGHNTDAYGFLRSLREAGFEPASRKTVVLGAGGSARAVASVLAGAAADEIVVSGRSLERAKALAGGLRPLHLADAPSVGTTVIAAVEWQSEDLRRACQSADLIVNCTPLGTRYSDFEDETPVGVDHFRAGAFAFDLVYNPPRTPFLSAALSVGARPVSGLEMLVYQGAESIRLWTGREPPVEVMRAAAEKALAGA